MTRPHRAPFAPLFAEFAHLSAFLTRPPADLSAAAILGWPAYKGGECLRCGAFTGVAFPRGCSGGCPSCTPPPPFTFARSLFAYEGQVREGIRAAKYGRRAVAVEALAVRLHGAVRDRWSDLFPFGFRPAVVPVPIHPLKYFLRGFNLPAFVGRALARRAGWAFAPLALRRGWDARPQAGSRLTDRRENVRDAFRVPAGVRTLSDVLILDDVYTSGATAAACAGALKTAGARHIVVLTVARTVL
ncbi:MAG: hypothetical protein M0Z38_12170 [Deltaproteobacteria bacterium]|nr:hypothetical protein [Deltaproteobacteria bacterium]